KLPSVTDHVTEISETLCPEKNLPEVNVPTTLISSDVYFEKSEKEINEEVVSQSDKSLKTNAMIHKKKHITVHFSERALWYEVRKGKKGWLSHGSVAILCQVLTTKRVMGLLNDAENKGLELHSQIIIF
ncbi:9562_t:CDS:2, partial [Funneliformis mosseae]